MKENNKRELYKGKTVSSTVIRKALAEAFAHGSNFSMYSEPSPDIVETVYRKYFG